MYTNSNIEAWQQTVLDLRGLSGDSKPTGDEVPNGSSFLEMDTGNVYFWDKANEQWRAI